MDVEVVINVHLFGIPYTTFYISHYSVVLSDKRCYKWFRLGAGDCPAVLDEYYKIARRSGLKFVASAFFLKPFVQECQESDIYRYNVLRHLNELRGYPENGIVFLKLILEPPDKEIIDYAW